MLLVRVSNAHCMGYDSSQLKVPIGSQRHLNPKGNAGAEQVTPTHGDIFLYLEEHAPTIIEVEGVFVTYRGYPYELVQVATAAHAKPEVAMIVASTRHAGLVGETYIPNIVIVPKRVTCDITGFRVFVVLYVIARKIFHCTVIVHLVFICQCGFKSSRVGSAHAKHQAVSVPLSEGGQRKQAGKA